MKSPVAVGQVPAELSLHSRIVNDIEGRILSGDWAPGQRVPFEMELAAHYGCSRMTVNKASRITAVTPSGHVYVDDDMARVLGSVSGFSVTERRRRLGMSSVTASPAVYAPVSR